METNNELKALKNFYGLLMEMNYHKEPADFVEELQEENPFVSLHLKNVMLHRTKAKAILKKKKYLALKEQFFALKELGLDKLQELFAPKERTEMVKLFRKFDELTEKDIDAINDDQDFLIFISSLKDKLEDKDGTK
ncbi:hypothetical protein [Yeosuana marina]|uniref:hypothetical protein n=1 Tax=Yeosuana marina TaxID=1565536 RepID=UPI001421908B|nr:hypothetical protein [Yeosuana marina]